MNLSDVVSIEKVSVSQYDYCVSWKVNSLCNFNCYFCLQKGSNSNSFSKEELENNYKELSVTLDKINAELIDLHDKYILINLIGGEPTLSDLPRLLSNLNCGDNKIKIAIISNLSCTDEYINRLRLLCNKQLKIHFNPSLHETETSADLFIEKVKRNIDMMKTVSIVIHDEISLSIYKRMVNEFDGKIKVNPQIINENNCLTLDDELINQIQFSKKKNFLVNNCNAYDKYELVTQLTDDNNKYPNFVGYKCNPFIRIKDGIIYHCNRNHNDKKYKDIFIEDRVICNAETCRLCNFVKIEK